MKEAIPRFVLYKGLFISLFILGMSWAVKAQQRPQYTLYFQNNYVLNPAITGIEDYTDAKLSYRKQWVGINGSPVTGYLSVQGPLGDPAHAHGGLGGLVVADKTGPDSRITVNGSYAFHIPISGSVRASFGIAGGFTQYTLNTNELTFDQYGTSDPAVPTNRGTQFLPDLVLGIWIYSDKFYLGGALNQLIPSALTFGSGNVNPKEALKGHSFFTAGVKIPMGPDFNFLPSVLVKYISPAPVSYDFNGKILYRDLLWLGASGRREDGYSIAAGINISSLLNVSYSYDYTTSALQKFTSGSHEIILGLQLGNHTKTRCPKMLW
jgi:type IX secretion system PorP/SprF family membrane protein